MRAGAGPRTAPRAANQTARRGAMLRGAAPCPTVGVRAERAEQPVPVRVEDSRQIDRVCGRLGACVRCACGLRVARPRARESEQLKLGDVTAGSTGLTGPLVSLYTDDAPGPAVPRAELCLGPRETRSGSPKAKGVDRRRVLACSVHGETRRATRGRGTDVRVGPVEVRAGGGRRTSGSSHDSRGRVSTLVLSRVEPTSLEFGEQVGERLGARTGHSPQTSLSYHAN